MTSDVGKKRALICSKGMGEAPITNHLSNFRANCAQYEVVEIFPMPIPM